MRLVSWKSGNALAVCALAIALGHITTPATGSAAGAQDEPTLEQAAPAASAAPAAQQPAAKPSAEKPPAPPESSAARREASLGPNVRVEVTITDQVGADAGVKKTLSVIAADRFSGSIRSKVGVAVPGPEGPGKMLRYEDLPLNVDVSPTILSNGLIRLVLVLNYQTFNTSTKERVSGTAIQSEVTTNQAVVLENGKPLIVSQSADAATDRKVTLELKATVLK